MIDEGDPIVERALLIAHLASYHDAPPFAHPMWQKQSLDELRRWHARMHRQLGEPDHDV